MIDPLGSVPRLRAAAAAAPQAPRPAERAATPRTDLPKLVALAADLARQGPPVDYARVAQLRQAIADGSYVVDAKAIASAMAGEPRGDAA